MSVILGVDAAWTVTEPSGVALVAGDCSAWRCIAVAPSYDHFLAQAEGRCTDWLRDPILGTAPDVPRLLAAAQRLAGTSVDLVALDMPVATVAFSSRRAADDAISREFGARWCSAHTPSAKRPGPLGAGLMAAFSAAGFTLSTTANGGQGGVPNVIEVYPHPALLSLLRRHRRVPYKVSKSREYWPELDVQQRITALLAEFNEIHSSLERSFGPLGLLLPGDGVVQNLAQLKRYEDALDALVCAWVGAEYLGDRAIPLGDDSAAIWCPRDVVVATLASGKRLADGW